MKTPNDAVSFSLLDKLLIQCNQALATLVGTPEHVRENPATNTDELPLTSSERKHSAGLMRVNHTGEVCAQALYHGQLVFAKTPDVVNMLQHAAEEEADHLAWCQQRLEQLDSHRSFLNPLWYGQSFMLGMVAGLAGDAWSLGFVAETERQVEQHLHSHLEKLPQKDHTSRAIVQQMKIDEAEHGANATQAGAKQLPGWMQVLMSGLSKVMTKSTYYF